MEGIQMDGNTNVMVLKEIGKDYTRKFWKCLFAEAALIIVPLVVFFGIGGITLYLQTPDDIEAVVIVGMAVCLIFLYLPLAVWLFFVIPRRILFFRPFPEAERMGRQEIVDSLSALFSSAEKDGKKIFDLQITDNKMHLPWSADVFAFQLLSVSGIQLKHIFILTFNDDSRTIKVVQRGCRTDWALSLEAARINLQFSQGIFMEYDRAFYPSLVFLPDHTIRFEAEKIRYNSNEIVKSLMYVAAIHGWNVEFGMV
jgi:hypothetical protein